jgi:hypothetical protein
VKPLPVRPDVLDITRIVDLAQLPMHKLVLSELQYTGFDRTRLWTDDFFARPDTVGLALVANRDSGSKREELVAWVVIRRCSKGFKVGPLYAKSFDSAREVLATALEKATADLIKESPLDNEPLSDMAEDGILESAEISTAVWSGNPAAENLFTELGFELAGKDLHRMWLDGKATKEQSEGGRAQEHMFAVFDPTIG